MAYPPQKPKDPSNYVTSFVPKGQWTPLMYAAREGAADAAMALVALGADVNVRDPEGVTPLIEAILNAHFDLAAWLLDHGANPNLVDNAGMGPLYAAIDMNTPPWERSRPDARITSDLDCVGLMRVLLDHGADVNARITGRLLSRYHAGGAPGMIDGTTPLIRAAKYANHDMVALLVSRGADVTLAQSDGTTALMFAAGVKYSITQQGDPAEPRQPGRRARDREAAPREGRGPERGEQPRRNRALRRGLRGAQQGHQLPGRATAASLDARTKQGLTGTGRRAQHRRGRGRHRLTRGRQAGARHGGAGARPDGGGRTAAGGVERQHRQGASRPGARNAQARRPLTRSLRSPARRRTARRALGAQARRPVHQHGDRFLRLARRVDEEALAVR